MKIVKNKALQLRLRNPDKVLSTIPKSAVLKTNGETTDVLVNWGLDEATVLKNLGVKNVPSPIIGQYSWPGMYTPMAHQKITANFLTLHKRAYCFNEQGCVDSETEYLTPSGWVKISEYDGGEVAQYHPDTGGVDFVEPLEYVKLPCTQMIRFKSSTTDQLLSPEHRMLLYRDGFGHYVEQAAVFALRYLTGEGVGADLIDSSGELKEILPDDGGSSVSLEQSTDGYKYCFMVPSTFLVFRRNGCVFASGNTGKTLSVAWAADYLLELGAIKRVLIICPLSTMKTAWQADLFKSAMHRRVSVAHGTREQRKRIIEAESEFVIINTDGVGTVIKDLQNAKFDLVVIDEATSVKTASTARWKAINSLVRPNTWLWMLTGTPAAQTPMDAYGLARMMDPSRAPRSMTSWRDDVMVKVSKFKWVPRSGWRDKVFDLLQPAIRYTKEECLDLPELIYTTREVPLTKQQQAVYDLIRSELAVVASGEVITAANAASGMSKLLQISSGSAYTDDGASLEFDMRPRYNELCSIIDESPNKVLVFVPFTNMIDRLSEELNKDGYKTEVIDGRVSANKRADIISRFQMEPEGTRVLVMQPQAVSHGITLHAADTSVWWGPVTSYEVYAQANDRMHRKGQKNACLVVNLQGSPVERIRYKALQNMSDDQGSLMAMYAEVLKG